MTEKTLIDIKKEYEKIKQKYGLPSFEEMNNEFEIERLQERDSDLFIRRLRRNMVEKVVHMLKFLEIMINPSSAPIFIHDIIGSINDETKKVIEKLYEEGCKIEMRSFALELISTEKDEIEFIKYVLKKWTDMKKDVEKLNQEIDKAWIKKEEKKEEKKRQNSFTG